MTIAACHVFPGPHYKRKPGAFVIEQPRPSFAEWSRIQTRRWWDGHAPHFGPAPRVDVDLEEIPNCPDGLRRWYVNKRFDGGPWESSMFKIEKVAASYELYFVRPGSCESTWRATFRTLEAATESVLWTWRKVYAFDG